MSDDYPGVTTEEDEEKKGKYPIPVLPPPAMPADATAPMPQSMPEAVAGATPPTFGQSSAPAPISQSTVPTSNMAPPAMPAPTQPQPMAPNPNVPPPAPPSWSQYAPPEPHGLAKVGHIAAAFSPKMNEYFNVAPERRAEQRYGAATGEYNEQLKGGVEARKETSEEELRHAQATQDLQRPATAEDIARINAQSRQGVADTNVGGRKDVANINQTGAGERNAATIAGAGERNTETNETRKEVAGEKKGDEGTWSIQEDSNGNPIEFNDKTGATRPAPNVQKSGTHTKASDAAKKLTEPVDTAVGYADDYLTNGAFTGPGDEALQEKFFELAKPATGFRMTQPQMDMLRNSRGWMGGAEAHLRHMATGTWFSNDQRQQIVNTMKELAESKKKAIAGEGESNEPKRPKGVPDDAKWDAKTRTWNK